jgi:hypothetical protein
MKTAYELAMERLNKTAPLTPLTPEQKARLAELDAEYKAKIADREIFIQGKLEAARAAGDWETMDALTQQLASERKALQAELEEKKEKIRQQAKK